MLTRGYKLVHRGLKTGKRGFRILWVDKAESPWRGLDDRRTDRVTSTEAPTKGSDKHTGPGTEAERSIDCLRKRPLQAKQLQSTREVHVKGHCVLQ